MSATGITLDGDAAERWLQSAEASPAFVEVRIPGYPSRPPRHHTWLREGRWQVLIRSPLPSLRDTGSDARTLSDWSRAVSAWGVVWPLADSLPGVSGTSVLPIRRSAASLRDVRARLRVATAETALSQLLEPLAFPIDLPSDLKPLDFVRHLCLDLAARALLDVGTLITASRNGQGAIEPWLRELEPEMVGALRLGSVRQQNGYWIRDGHGVLDDDCWDVLEAASALLKPEIVLLDPPESVEDDRAIEGLMARMAEATRRRASISVPQRLPAGSVRPVPGAHLHVLDDEGVLFFAERRELSTFNTMATALWCWLEDGHDVGGLVANYAAAANLASSDAAHVVADVLLDWFGQGYIDGPGPLVSTPAPFSRAVAYLVLNAPHRTRFRTDAIGLARALGLSHEAEVTAFVGIDPSALDDFASDLALAHAPQVRVTDRRRVDTRARRRSENFATYRLLGTTFGVDTQDSDLARRIATAWPQLSCASEAIDVDLAIRPEGAGRWKIVEDGAVGRSLERRAVVPAVKEVMRRLGSDRFPSVMNVHAGAVSCKGGAVLLPAEAGSGKTTLTAALVHAGAKYFTDEIAPLMVPSFELVAVPLSLTVKAGSIEPLRTRYPGLCDLDVYAREDRIDVRYMPPPSWAATAGEGERERVRWIVFPRYVPDSITRLAAIGRPVALRRLLDEAYLDRARLTPDVVEQLVKWMRGVECFELTFGSLDAAVALVMDLSSH